MNTLPHEWLGDLATYIPKKDLVTFLKVDSYVYLSLLISYFKLYTCNNIGGVNIRISFISYNYFQYKDWYNNGQLDERYYYINGFQHGLYKEWHENGQIAERSYYINGELHGQYKRWYPNGQLNERCYYKNGEIYNEHTTS